MSCCYLNEMLPHVHLLLAANEVTVLNDVRLAKCWLVLLNMS